MEISMKETGHTFWIVLLLIFVGCAHKAPVVYVSQPEISKESNEAFDVQIETLKLENPFYVAFQMTLTNKSEKPLEIDWERTRYIHEGKSYGRIIFPGVSPESVKSGIPREIIPAGQTLSKRLMPIKTLAFRGRSEKIREGQSNFYPGILPNGRNTVGLVVTQAKREWKVPLTVRIAVR
jgi:hypothetical protein